jgi:hypothetical protein
MATREGCRVITTRTFALQIPISQWGTLSFSRRNLEIYSLQKNQREKEEDYVDSKKYNLKEPHTLEAAYHGFGSIYLADF